MSRAIGNPTHVSSPAPQRTRPAIWYIVRGEHLNRRPATPSEIPGLSNFKQMESSVRASNGTGAVMTGTSAGPATRLAAAPRTRCLFA
jgi:hypothetical protein